jgi:hypothetical protein
VNFFRFFRVGFFHGIAASLMLLICGCCPSGRQPGDKGPEKPSGKSGVQAPADTPPASESPAKEQPPKPVKTPVPTSLPASEVAIPDNLGEPLVDHPKNLVPLDKKSPVWIDKTGKQVVLIGSVCNAGYPLEFFATYPDRAYESVVVVYTRPSVVHAALLRLGAEPGKPAQFQPKFVLPSGPKVEIEVRWKDKDGKLQKARAQDWIRDIKTKKPMDVDWVFAGSVFWKDPKTGVESYLADRGEFICVLNLPTALLDVPIESASGLESRLFEGNTDRLPPEGTPVTLILKPKLGTGKQTK